DTVIITRGESIDSYANISTEPPEIGPEAAVPASQSPETSLSTPPGIADSQVKVATNGDSAAKAPAARPTPTSPEPSSNGSAPPPVNASDNVPLPSTITINLSEILERGDTQNNIALQAGDVVTVPHAGIVYALGAVARPGGFVAANDRAQLSTLKLLALAGGTTRVAQKDRAVIIRKEAAGEQTGSPGAPAENEKRANRRAPPTPQRHPHP